MRSITPSQKIENVKICFVGASGILKIDSQHYQIIIHSCGDRIKLYVLIAILNLPTDTYILKEC